MNHDLASRDFRRILLIKPSSLGDVVRCLPILAGLKQRYPAARIGWMLRPDCAELLGHNRDLDEIILFDRGRFGRIGRSLAATGEFAAFVNRLRRRRFDLVLDLQGLFRSAFLALCTEAPVRMGFVDAREFSPCFYTHRVTIHRRAEHVVDSYWRFAGKLGFAHLPKRFELDVPAAGRRTAGDLMGKNGLEPGSSYLVFLVGGSHQAKRWPAANFAALADRCRDRYDSDTVLLGAGQAELSAARQVASRCGGRLVNLVNQTDIAGALAILQGARLVVGNDSGPLHLAAALGVPLVGLYGPTNPDVVGPYGHLDDVVQAGCEVPRRRRYSRHPLHQMERISVEQVMAAVRRKLD